MFYIKLDEDMQLIVTSKEPLYRGDNLNQKITFLIPKIVGEIDMLTATIFLTYVRSDGVPDIEILERKEDYNESYYQYVLPITCKLTAFPGEVCLWMQIYTGTPSNPTIAKSGECMLYVQNSKNADDYFCDHKITALYQIYSKLIEQGQELATKADGLVYDAEEESLSLTSDGEKIGSPVDVSDMVNKDDVIHFGDENTPDNGTDAVIYF